MTRTRLRIGDTATRPIIMNSREPVTCLDPFESRPCSSRLRTIPSCRSPRLTFHASAPIPAFGSSPPHEADTAALFNLHVRAKTSTGPKTASSNLFNGTANRNNESTSSLQTSGPLPQGASPRTTASQHVKRPLTPALSRKGRGGFYAGIPAQAGRTPTEVICLICSGKTECGHFFPSPCAAA